MVALLASIVLASAGAGGVQTSEESPLPLPSSGAVLLVKTANSPCTWFTEMLANRVACLGRLGDVRQYKIQSPGGLGVASDGSLWVVEAKKGIVRVDERGSVSRYPSTSKSPLFDLTVRDPSKVWFSLPTTKALGVVLGSRLKYSIDLAVRPIRLASANGSVWFTTSDDEIGRIGSDGQVALFSLRGTLLCYTPECRLIKRTDAVPNESPGLAALATATGLSDGLILRGISADSSDGSAWFAAWDAPVKGGAAIGHIKYDGTVTYYPTPTAGSYPSGVAYCGDDVWFTEYGSSRIGRLAIEAVPPYRIDEWPTPTPNSGPTSIACDGEGIVYIESRANNLGSASTLRPVAAPAGNK